MVSKKRIKRKFFYSFVQEDNSTTRRFGGTGLGLAISNQLLGLMKSKLELKSDFGKGSNFFFTVELKKVKSKKVIKNKVGDDSFKNKKVNVDDNRNFKILIVEDNKINMLLSKTLLKKLVPNCRIVEANNGDDAVLQFKTEQPDLILMDIQMPEKNGYETTAEIRNLNTSENIPIIALTAGIMLGEKEKCLEAGMNDYISKPIIEAELEQKLIQWLQL